VPFAKVGKKYDMMSDVKGAKNTADAGATMRDHRAQRMKS
jgi:hypothetical protein